MKQVFKKCFTAPGNYVTCLEVQLKVIDWFVTISVIFKCLVVVSNATGLALIYKYWGSFLKYSYKGAVLKGFCLERNLLNEKKLSESLLTAGVAEFLGYCLLT